MFGIDIGAMVSGAIAENRAKNLRVPLSDPYLEAICKLIDESPIPELRIYGSGRGLPDLSFRVSAKEHEKRLAQKRENERGGVSLAGEESVVGAVSAAEDGRGALSESCKAQNVQS